MTPSRPADPAIDVDARFSTAIPAVAGEETAQRAWWRSAVAGPLATALDTTLQRSPALRRALADVDTARAELREARSNRGPRLLASADAGLQKASSDTRRSSRSAAVDGSLPIDANGALADRERAARQTLAAASADAEQLRSDLARDLLLAVVDLAEARQRRALLDRQTASTDRQLQLVELRFTQGLASSVDVLQQRDQLAALRQQVPLAEFDALRAANTLRRLGGLSPATASGLERDTLPALDPGYATLRPRDLLQRRPALRAAQSRLEAADARFAAALADRWPTLSLSAGVLTRTLSGDVTTLVDAAIDAALTLFDSGNKIAIAERRRAQLAAAGQQLLADWVDSVIDADTLLHEANSLDRRLALSAQRLETAQALLRAAQRRYERGVSDYLPVLSALTGLQQQQRDDLALQAALGRTRVRLHHALGYVPDGGGT
ncbi:MAG: TolC family protein [Gammaproteobacteria bacterium]|nr:TolC family protein [Gammaproteobacteria bacterium]